MVTADSGKERTVTSSSAESVQGYGVGQYGHGEYGKTQTIMPPENTHRDAGEQFVRGVDDDLTDIKQRLESAEQAIADFDPSGDGLDADEVRAIVSEELDPIRVELDGHADEFAHVYGRIDDLDQRVTAIEERDWDSGGGSSGDGGLDDETQAEIEQELAYLRLTGRPKHRSTIATGHPEGDYHAPGDWGQIVTVHDPVHWTTAIVDAETEGVTELVVYEMEYEAPVFNENGEVIEGGIYDLGDVHQTVELHHDAGIQEVYPNVTLPEGQYFVTRDSEEVQPMRRVQTDIDWDEFNANNDVPITFECSWRAFANYRPGGENWSKYRENDWDKRLYYWSEMEFGHQIRAGENGG